MGPRGSLRLRSGQAFDCACGFVNESARFAQDDKALIFLWRQVLLFNRGDDDVVLELGPRDGAAFDHAQLHAGFQWNLDGGAGDFAIAHGGVAVTDVEQPSFYIHGKINRVADAGFGGIHVAAEFGGDDGTASFALGGGDADAAEERMQRNLHGEIGVVGLEGRGVGSVIDVVVPDAFGQRWMQHWRVIGFVEGTESGSEGAYTGVAIDIE